MAAVSLSIRHGFSGEDAHIDGKEVATETQVWKLGESFKKDVPAYHRVGLLHGTTRLARDRTIQELGLVFGSEV